MTPPEPFSFTVVLADDERAKLDDGAQAEERAANGAACSDRAGLCGRKNQSGSRSRSEGPLRDCGQVTGTLSPAPSGGPARRAAFGTEKAEGRSGGGDRHAHAGGDAETRTHLEPAPDGEGGRALNLVERLFSELQQRALESPFVSCTPGSSRSSGT